MDKTIRILVPLLLMAAFPVSMYYMFSLDVPRSGTAPVVSVPVTATKLVEDYASNEVGADLIYGGTIVYVSGTIADIGKGLFGESYITMNSGKPGLFEKVQCVFADESTLQASNLSKGQFVTVRGVCSGKLGNVIVDDCSIYFGG